MPENQPGSPIPQPESTQAQELTVSANKLPSQPSAGDLNGTFKFPFILSSKQTIYLSRQETFIVDSLLAGGSWAGMKKSWFDQFGFELSRTLLPKILARPWVVLYKDEKVRASAIANRYKDKDIWLMELTELMAQPKPDFGKIKCMEMIGDFFGHKGSDAASNPLANIQINIVQKTGIR